jgi:DNA-binding MarR family transcriptional regulator
MVRRQIAVRAAEPTWLNEDELATWMVLIGVLFRLPAALDSQLRRDAGLTHFDYGVLAALSNAPSKTMRMSDLADFSQCSLSRLSHGVKRLEERGWVRRSPLPTDGRITIAKLTPAGLRMLVATAPGHVDEVRRLVMQGLSPEQLKVLRDVGRSILERIDPSDPETGSATDGSE